MEKERYKMREPKELFTPLPLVTDSKSGLMKQQLPKKGGTKHFSKHFSKKCRKTHQTKCRKTRQTKCRKTSQTKCRKTSRTKCRKTRQTKCRKTHQTKCRKTYRKKTIKKSGTKKQFLFNPENPKKSFDVYIDKNPKDTIKIKYTTVEDVKNTIDRLEKLYKNKKYTHKRIWQVGMIMYVRLKVLKHIKPKQYALANKYFNFLGKRTKLEEKERYKLSFDTEIL
jgi:hypothetical protein